ncbi:orf70 [Lactobacillus phage LP65]|uniref:Orf70 n=1 Tax=Lactobacillus phage LP65 TaxID=2892344 RepID=Q5ULP4_9CAUD|nr:exonuclease [Lactobacillus phage LP65]AAV35890.1 orf70 [Lactobacillus phage LP65]
MKLETIKIRNFRSIRSLDFKIDSRGLTLISGKNGQGKSSIYAAILYALFNKTQKGQTADAIINDVAKKNTSVILNYENAGVRYRVCRYRKHKENHNKVLFYVNEVEKTSSSNKLTDELIEASVGMSFDTMLNSFVLGDSLVTNFSVSTDKQRKEIIEDITNISIYKKASSVASDKYKEAKEVLDSVERTKSNLEIKVESLKKQLELEKSQEKQRKENINYAKNSYEASLKEYEELDKSFEKSKQETSDVPDKIASLKVTLNSLKEEQYNLESPKETNSIQRKLNAEMQKKNTAVERAKRSKADLNKFGSQYKEIKNAKQATCLYCGSPLNEEHKKTELARLADEGRKCLDVINTEKQVYKEANAAYSKLESELDRINEYNSQLQPKTIELNNKINQTMSEINSLEKSIDATNMVKSNVESSARTVNTYKANLERLESEPSIDTEGTLKSLEEATSSLKEYQSKFDEDTRKVKVLDGVKGVFSNTGIKSFVLEQVYPAINESLEKYMSVLTDGSISATISAVTENKSGNVSDKINIKVFRDAESTDYDSLSSGEQRRFDVALSLSLQDYVSSNSGINVLFLDEIFDSLDAVGVDKVMTLLKEKSKQYSSVFVISHSTELKDNFDNEIKVVKTEAGTKIE